MNQLFHHDVPGGSSWSTPLRAGRMVTLTALGPDACVSVLLFGPDRLDRLNVPDTLKSQMSACVRPPMVLMSDRGLALATVVASTLEWHDCLTGFGHDAHLERFGASSYASDRNDWRRSARSGLIAELTKHGLGESDLHGPVNFFTQVVPSGDARATLAYQPGHSTTGDAVTLRTELDLLLVLSTAPHPMAAGEYQPAGVRVEVGPATPTTGLAFREEALRALEMSRRVLA